MKENFETMDTNIDDAKVKFEKSNSDFFCFEELARIVAITHEALKDAEYFDKVAEFLNLSDEEMRGLSYKIKIFLDTYKIKTEDI